MNMFYRENSTYSIYLMIIGFALPFLILLNENNNPSFNTIVFLLTGLTWLGVLREFYAMSNQRIADLELFAHNNNYNFISKPTSENLSQFNNFKAMQKILGIAHINFNPNNNSFVNLLTPKENLDTSKIKNPEIVTIKTVVSSGESGSSTHYTQVSLFNMEKEIPIFCLTGGFQFSFGSFYNNNYFFKGIKELKRVDVKKSNFPIHKYKLYSSSPKIHDFITNKFIDLLNDGLRQKKKRLYIESDGKSIIFYVKYKRYTSEGINFYTNLFKVLIDSLERH